jgi:hypothetical protein
VKREHGTGMDHIVSTLAIHPMTQVGCIAMTVNVNKTTTKKEYYHTHY